MPLNRATNRALCLLLVVVAGWRNGGVESGDTHNQVLDAEGVGGHASKEDDGTLAMVEVASHAMPNPLENVYPWDTIKLQFDMCHGGPAYARAAPANVHLLTNAEKCGLCEVIVENSMMWNWKRHLSALCSRVPRHMLPLVRYLRLHQLTGIPGVSSSLVPFILLFELLTSVYFVYLAMLVCGDGACEYC